jgi:hypothetical protein
MSHRRFLTLAAIAAVLILGAYAATQVHLAIRFSRPCRLLPKAEWTLLKTGPDVFEARLLDRRRGNHQRIDLFRFPRGDVVSFVLSAGIAPGCAIEAGTEIAQLDSFGNRERLSQLLLELEVAQAGLHAAQTGEKAEIVAQARSEVDAARAEATRTELEYQRARAMREQALVSETALQLALAEREGARATLEAAENNLRAAEAGEKEAVVATWQANVDLLRRQVADARQRIEAERICSPVAGQFTTTEGDSALARVAATDTLYAVAAVSPSRARYLQPGHPATIRGLDSRRPTHPAQVARVDRRASAAGEASFFWATVAVPNPDGELAAGVRGTLHFEGRQVSLIGWLADWVRHASDRTLGV